MQKIDLSLKILAYVPDYCAYFLVQKNISSVNETGQSGLLERDDPTIKKTFK